MPGASPREPPAEAVPSATGCGYLPTVTARNGQWSGVWISVEAGGGEDGQMDGVARNSAFPTFAHFVLYSHLAGFKTPCTYSGVIVPSV
jgi:hypothetical protein